MKTLGAVAVVLALLSSCEPTYNMYGGINYTDRINDGLTIVYIPDETGKIVCNYPVRKGIGYNDMTNLDCEDGQTVTVEVDGD